MSQVSDNLRIEDRKSLFVQGTLHYIDGFCSITIRNMSPAGALIEAERLPRSGTPVELRRGPLSVMGTVMWKRSGRAGIEFLNETDVRRWLPKGMSQAVGENAFEVFKGIPASPFVAPKPSAGITPQDIEAVAVLLDDLAETFAKDAGLVYNYSTKLQALDIAAEMLRKLALEAKVRGPKLG